MPALCTTPAPQRFALLVEERGDCLVWLGKSFNAGGQPLFTAATQPRRVRVVAGRWLYEFHHGALPSGAILFPDCSTPLCVRHMRVGSQAEFARWNEEDRQARFWARVKQVEGEGCWEWQASCFPNGYGQAHYQGRGQGAHRISWKLTNGPIPANTEVCHRCDNPPCVRPDHLFLGSRAVNAADMTAKGRAARNRNGAKLTDEQVRSIRTQYTAGGVSLAKLAAANGVTTMSVHSVVKRKTYTHVA